MLLNRVRLIICFAFIQSPVLLAVDHTQPMSDTHVTTYSSQGLRDNEVELGQRNPKVIATDNAAVSARVKKNKTIENTFWDSYLLPDQINLWLGLDYQNTADGRAFYRQHAKKSNTGDYQGHWEYYKKLRELHGSGLTGDDINYPTSFKQWLYIMYQLHEHHENSTAIGESN